MTSCSPSKLLFNRGFAKGKGKGKAKVTETPDTAGAASAAEFKLDTLKEGINASVTHFQHELSNFRSGRATPEMLDFVQVDAYGEATPLKAVAAVAVRSSQLLALTVYDPTLIDNVVKAVRDSPLSLNPSKQGQEVLVPVPSPTKETVRALEGLVHKAAEAAKVSIRHVRHKGINDAKAALASKDDQKRAEKDIQKLVDSASSRIDDIAKHKIQSLHS